MFPQMRQTHRHKVGVLIDDPLSRRMWGRFGRRQTSLPPTYSAGGTQQPHKADIRQCLEFCTVSTIQCLLLTGGDWRQPLNGRHWQEIAR